MYEKMDTASSTIDADITLYPCPYAPVIKRLILNSERCLVSVFSCLRLGTACSLESTEIDQQSWALYCTNLTSQWLAHKCYICTHDSWV